MTLPEMQQIKQWDEQANKENKVLILLIGGHSCSGKTTRAAQLGFSKIITNTTRPPRPGEKNGVDYNFISEEEFKSHKEDYLEVTSYGWNLYGTLKTEFNKKINKDENCYMILDINGIINIKNELAMKYPKDFLVKSIYYMIDKDTFQKRVKARDGKIATKEYIDSRWHENKIAEIKIKTNPKIIDLKIDATEEIKSFSPKSM